MKIFFPLIFLFSSFSLYAQDSTLVRKRNIIKPHVLFSLYKTLSNSGSAFNIEFERGLNKRNSISAQVVNWYYNPGNSQFWNENFLLIQYRHYFKNKKDKALRGFYLGAEIFSFQYTQKNNGYNYYSNNSGLIGLFGYQTFIKDRISLDFGLGPGIAFRIWEKKVPVDNPYTREINPAGNIYFSIGYSFFSR
jgi:putative salt-induced outer membrane protein YdiY